MLLKRLRDRQLASTIAPRSQRKQFIYVLKIGILYKIGRSMHPIQRIRGMQLPSSPDSLDVYEVENSKDVELSLHRRFASQREHGEWFVLSEQDYAQIAPMVDELKAGRTLAKVYPIGGRK